MSRKISIILLFVMMLYLITSCGQAKETGDIAVNPNTQQGSHEMEDSDLIEKEDEKDKSNDIEEDENDPESEEENGEVAEDDMSDEDLKAMGINELGKIMILMYHDIGLREDTWVRTPENLRKDLKVLYDKGYRAISLKDYINGDINTPAGTTPVVLTFDDGTKGQFNVLDDQGDFTVDPDCAVGILEEFYSQYPEFGLEATFFVYYPNPFGQKNLIEQKMKYIIDRGMDIGNHAYNHENLRRDTKTKEPRDASFIQESLGKHIIATNDILPGYQVDSLALPYGERPQGDLYQYVVKGSHQGVEYHHKAVLLVGSNPALSPYHINLDMANVPRIRASEIETYNTGLYDWLDYFDKHPEERFVSDGNKDIISFPKELEEQLNADVVNGKIIRAYE